MKIGNTVEIVEYNKNDTEFICVIGCLKNERGLSILNELLSWAKSKYHIFIVYQDYPGTMYEYPALKVAQDLSSIYEKPTLYMHTKGAFNNYPNSPFVRKLWKELFIDNYDWCKLQLQTTKNVVCTNFTGKTKVTWYNAFLADVEAWKELKINKSSNRWIYEVLFETTNSTVKGFISNEMNDCNQMTLYLRKLQQIK